jgi:hypothetical protein
MVSGAALEPLGGALFVVSAAALEGDCNPTAPHIAVFGCGVGASVVVSEPLGGATALMGDCNHAAPRMASALKGDCDQTTAPAMASVNHAVNARMLRNFSGALRAGLAMILAISFTVYSA